jgi:Kef-type K+ transport system membrane component KefB
MSVFDFTSDPMTQDKNSPTHSPLMSQNKSALLFFGFMAAPITALGTAGRYSDRVAPILLALILIFAAAKLGSEISERFEQPAVLGELIAGVILGNLILVEPRWEFFESLRVENIEVYWAVAIDSLARIGVILLLFEVGLESSFKSMAKLGSSSLLVAVMGVIAPFSLGYGVSALFISELPRQLIPIVPDGFSPAYVHMFIGAVLCATSVGITARVLKDLGKLRTMEAQIILGAAVIDDILGLIILAVVSGIVSAAAAGQSMEIWSVFRLIGVAVLFLAGSMAGGMFLVPKLMKQLSHLKTSGVMLISALFLAFLLSYLATAVGLAAIVGAFAAGLLLEDVHFHGFRENISIGQILRPISIFLVPIFFVHMGIQVRLEAFANPSVLGVASGLSLAAIIGKQICGMGVLQTGLDRLTVGVGMIPRGEVGLIFASIGKSLKVIDDATFSAIVIMVIVTTLITPPVLKITLSRWEKRHPRKARVTK